MTKLHIQITSDTRNMTGFRIEIIFYGEEEYPQFPPGMSAYPPSMFRPQEQQYRYPRTPYPIQLPQRAPAMAPAMAAKRKHSSVSSDQTEQPNKADPNDTNQHSNVEKPNDATNSPLKDDTPGISAASIINDDQEDRETVAER